MPSFTIIDNFEWGDSSDGLDNSPHNWQGDTFTFNKDAVSVSAYDGDYKISARYAGQAYLLFSDRFGGAVHHDVGFAIQNTKSDPSQGTHVRLQGSGGATAVDVHLNGNSGDLEVNGTTVLSFSYGTYYYVELRNPDFAAGTVDVWVNGSQAATDIAFQNSLSAFERIEIDNDFDHSIGEGSVYDYLRGQPQPPEPTLSVDATADSQIDLTWPSTPDADSYNLYVADSSGSSVADYSLLAQPTTTSYSHTGVGDGETNYYRLEAENAYGVSPLSNEVSATVPLPNPSDVQLVSQDGDQVTLAWTNHASGHDGNRIVVSRDGGSTWIQDTEVGPSETQAQTSHLLDGEEYVLTVESYNGDVTSKALEVV